MSNSSPKKKINFRKGFGDYIVFIVLAFAFASMMVLLIGTVQLTSSLNELTKAINVTGRAVAVSRNQDRAQELAEAVVGRTLLENRDITDSEVTIETVEEDAPWRSGTEVIVTVSADVHTFNPFVSGRRAKKILVTLEGRNVWNGEEMVFPLPGDPAHRPIPGTTIFLPGNYIITQFFKAGNATYEAHRGGHTGMDIGAPSGTPISAVADGEVVFVESTHAGERELSTGSYGNYVVIDHGGGLRTLYAHMKLGSPTVRVGDQVSAGDKIGEVGTTGASDGYHLHLEFQYTPEESGGSSILLNPAYFFSEKLADFADLYYAYMWEMVHNDIAWDDPAHFSIPGDPREIDFN